MHNSNRKATITPEADGYFAFDLPSKPGVKGAHVKAASLGSALALCRLAGLPPTVAQVGHKQDA